MQNVNRCDHCRIFCLFLACYILEVPYILPVTPLLVIMSINCEPLVTQLSPRPCYILPSHLNVTVLISNIPHPLDIFPAASNTPMYYFFVYLFPWHVQ
jgi:hypothetical protein